jgi:predicted O-methyltransferase YrrM
MSIVPPSAHVLEELRKTCERLPDDALVVEIGANGGATTRVILGTIGPRGGRVLAVDSYRIDYPWYTEGRSVKRLEEWLKALPDAEERVLLAVADSKVLARFIADGIIDLVFIDGDHRYSAVAEDIKRWWPKVKLGGIMCGDDCDGVEWLEEHAEQDFAANKHHGVIKAVQSAFPGRHIALGSFWVTQKLLASL